MDDFFGNSVAVSGNASVVGAQFRDDNGVNSGSAYVFSVPEPSSPALHTIALAALACLAGRAHRQRTDRGSPRTS